MTDDERERLRSVESAVAEIKLRQVEIEHLLKQSVSDTDAIKRDTAEIVELVKGAGVIGRISKWLAAILGGYLAGKGLKWW